MSCTYNDTAGNPFLMGLREHGFQETTGEARCKCISPQCPSAGVRAVHCGVCYGLHEWSGFAVYPVPSLSSVSHGSNRLNNKEVFKMSKKIMCLRQTLALPSCVITQHSSKWAANQLNVEGDSGMKWNCRDQPFQRNS